jgi:hypothetical protein
MQGSTTLEATGESDVVEMMVTAIEAHRCWVARVEAKHQRGRSLFNQAQEPTNVLRSGNIIGRYSADKPLQVPPPRIRFKGPEVLASDNLQ